MTRVAIVGAGVIGTCVAEAIEREGAIVVIVERGGTVRDAASSGNAGIVATGHDTPLAAPGVVGQGLRWMVRPESPFYIRPRLDAGLLLWSWRYLRSATRTHLERAGPVLADLHARSRRLFPELLARLEGHARLEGRGLITLSRSQQGVETERAAAHRGSSCGVRSEVLDASDVRSGYGGTTVDAVGAVFYPDDARVSPKAVMDDLQAHLARRSVPS